MVLTKDVKIEAVGLCGAVARHCFIWEFGCHALPVIYRLQANLGRRMRGTERGKRVPWWFWATAVPAGLRAPGVLSLLVTVSPSILQGLTQGGQSVFRGALLSDPCA